MDIHFTDDQGNEFYVGIRKGELSQIWKNKMDIPDFEVYVEELNKNTPMTAEQVLDQLIADLKLKEKISEYEGGILHTLEPEWASEYLHFDKWNKTYLNLAVYNEIEHDVQQLKMEQGI